MKRFVWFCLFSATAWAEPTREWSVSGPKEVFSGDPISTAVDARGVIRPGPVQVALTRGTDAPIVTLLAAPQGLYVGTAGGGLLEIGAAGQAKTLFTATDKVVTALAMHRGKLHFATAPDGQVYSMEGTTARPLWKSGGPYVWSLLDDRTHLLAATGDPGRIYRVSPAAQAELLLEPGETHVRSLLRHPKWGLVAGGGQKGIVYRLEGKGARALYDSEMDEVTAMVMDPATEDLYVALISESKAGVLVPDRWIGPMKGDAGDDDKNPIKGSELVRIQKSGHVEVLWSSKSEGALSLAFADKKLFFSTGTQKKGKSRIYALDTADQDRLHLWARLEPSLATALLSANQSLYVGTAPSGQVLRLGPGTSTESVFHSAEQDLARISTVGRLWFDASIPGGAKIELSVRTGNTKEVDATWSEWSAAVTTAEGDNVAIPRGRYAQMRAILRSTAQGEAPQLRSLHASVVRMNLAPTVREVFVLRRGVYMTTMPTEEEREKTLTLSKAVIRDLRYPANDDQRSRVRQGLRPGMLTAAWTADDANLDRLLFRVELQKEGGPWQEVASDLADEFWSFDSRAFPDGRYRLRVTASDRPDNPPDATLADTFESEAFVIDNGSPGLTGVRATAQGGKLTINAVASDAQSLLGEAMVSVNGGPWLMLPAVDGLLDSKKEALQVVLTADGAPGAPKLLKGINTLAVRVEDEAGNSAVAATTVTLP